MRQINAWTHKLHLEARLEANWSNIRDWCWCKVYLWVHTIDHKVWSLAYLDTLHLTLDSIQLQLCVMINRTRSVCVCFFHKLLSKRLLFGRPVSTNLEMTERGYFLNAMILASRRDSRDYWSIGHTLVQQFLLEKTKLALCFHHILHVVRKILRLGWQLTIFFFCWLLF